MKISTKPSTDGMRDEAISALSRSLLSRIGKLGLLTWNTSYAESDSMSHRTALRVFTAIDVFSRECLTLHVASSIRATDVTRALDRVIFTRGVPTTIQCDNGSEFACNHYDQWAHERGVHVDFIRPGRPVENAHIESFNGRLRDECLNAHWFTGLDDAHHTIEDWRCDYNETRPHSSLGDRAPATFVAELQGLSPAAQMNN